jgi:hypothetical protein
VTFRPSQPIYFNIIPPSPSITCQHCVFTLNGLLPPILPVFSSSHCLEPQLGRGSTITVWQTEREPGTCRRVGCSTAPGIAGVYECDNMLVNDKKMPSTNRNTWTFLERQLLLLLLLSSSSSSNFVHASVASTKSALAKLNDLENTNTFHGYVTTIYFIRLSLKLWTNKLTTLYSIWYLQALFQV